MLNKSFPHRELLVFSTLKLAFRQVFPLRGEAIQFIGLHAISPNNRFERDCPTAGFAHCLPTPQAERSASKRHGGGQQVKLLSLGGQTTHWKY